MINFLYLNVCFTQILIFMFDLLNILMNKIRTSILNFVFSKGFVRRRNLWYMVFVTPLVLFVTQIEAKRLDKVT
jgi:hypothetical protein